MGIYDCFVKVLTFREPAAQSFPLIFKRRLEVETSRYVATEWEIEDSGKRCRIIHTKRRHFHNTKRSFTGQMSLNDTPAEDVFLDDFLESQVREAPRHVAWGVLLRSAGAARHQARLAERAIGFVARKGSRHAEQPVLDTNVRRVPAPLQRNSRKQEALDSKRDARLVRNSESLPEGQAIHHGFVKPREAKHDADLYRLYQAEIERIEQAGGRATRVVLDYELKRYLNRDLAAFSSEEMTPEIRQEVAERHGLTVVEGKIFVPDLRVEYDTAEMERKYVDLELATRNYRPGALAAKAKAGFSLYARREDASRLRRVLDEREITAKILSL
ncbi:MAG TPA: hypothetical protein VGD60_01815 [Candidatus Acidoferrales bacterium]